jgi:hypothetical protein
MSWGEAVKAAGGAVALRERPAGDEGIFRSTQPASWDPYEVWLTRVKQPRDAAQAVTANASTRTR